MHERVDVPEPVVDFGEDLEGLAEIGQVRLHEWATLLARRHAIHVDHVIAVRE